MQWRDLCTDLCRRWRCTDGVAGRCLYSRLSAASSSAHLWVTAGYGAFGAQAWKHQYRAQVERTPSLTSGGKMSMASSRAEASLPGFELAAPATHVSPKNPFFSRM